MFRIQERSILSKVRKTLTHILTLRLALLVVSNSMMLISVKFLCTRSIKGRSSMQMELRSRQVLTTPFRFLQKTVKIISFLRRLWTGSRVLSVGYHRQSQRKQARVLESVMQLRMKHVVTLYKIRIFSQKKSLFYQMIVKVIMLMSSNY